MSSFSQNIGTGLGTYGKYKSVMSLLFSLLFGCICISISVLFFRYRYKKEANMKVLTSECSKVENGYQCTVSVEFEKDGQTYSNNNVSMSASKDLQPGDTVLLLYDPNDPNDIIDGVKINYIGWFFLVPACLLITFSSIYTILNFTSKGFSQVTGGISAGRQILPRGSTTNVYSGSSSYSPVSSGLGSVASPFFSKAGSYLGKVASQIIPKRSPRN